MNKFLTQTDLNISPEFIQGFEGNPFARLFCRNIVNKMCSGSCGECKKEREAFKENKVKQLGLRNISGDPHFEDIYGTPEEVWESWIRQIQKAKMEFWECRSAARVLADETARQSIITLH